MGIDYFIGLDCDTKRDFGEVDCVDGALAILACKKARDRADAVRKMLMEDGEDPAEVTLEMGMPDRDGNIELREVTLADLEASAKPIEGQEGPCVGCSANFLEQPYGCIGSIRYPFPSSAERWLTDRIQPYPSFGAVLFFQNLKDQGITGAHVRQSRGAGALEAKKPIKVSYKTGFLKKISANSDQLLEAVLFDEEGFSALQCYGILLMLGAIHFDGGPPEGQEGADLAGSLFGCEDPEKKLSMTTLYLGEESEDVAIMQIQAYLEAAYRAWVHGVPLFVSA